MDPFQNNAVFSPSPNTGDIILSPSAPAKKSKKPLVIVLVILVLLAAGAAAWYFLRPGNNTSSENIEPVLPSVTATPLNKYGNFLLYGTDSTENIVMEDDDSDIEGKYKITTIGQDSIEAQNTYFTKLSSLYSEFFTVLKNENIDIDYDALSNFASVIQDYRMSLSNEDYDQDFEKNYYMILHSYREIKEELLREK